MHFEKKKSTLSMPAMALVNRNKKENTECSEKDEEVFCYCCNTKVTKNFLKDHLLLGRLQCKFCLITIASCQKFKKRLFHQEHKCDGSKSGTHEFSKWHTNSVDYLSHFLRRELLVELSDFRKGSISTNQVLFKVKDYVSKLSHIEHQNPWRIPLKKCWKYLASKNMVREENIGIKHPCVKPLENFTEKNDSSFDKENEGDLQPLKGCSEVAVESNDTNNEKSSSSISDLATTVEEILPTEGLSGKSSDLYTELTTAQQIAESVSSNKTNEKHSNKSKLPHGQVLSDYEDGKEKATLPQEEIEPLPQEELEPLPQDELEPLPQEELEPLPQEELEPLPQEELEPDDGLLQNCNVERLDQTVEYVSVEDGSKEKKLIQHPTGDQELIQQERLWSNKRKMSSIESVRCTRPVKCHKTFDPSKDSFTPPTSRVGNHYLVVHFPSEECPEECPNCYCEFHPSMLTVNCSTFVSTIICADCNLTMYVVPD